MSEPTTPDQTSSDAANQGGDKLDALLDRINGLSSEDADAAPGRSTAETVAVERKNVAEDGSFFPRAPLSVDDLGISETAVEELITKFMMAKGESTVREIAEQVAIPVELGEKLVTSMKNEQLLGYIGQAALNDYVVKLTELGRERGRRYNEFSTYFGAAPVPFKQYLSLIHI